MAIGWGLMLIRFFCWLGNEKNSSPLKIRRHSGVAPIQPTFTRLLFKHSPNSLPNLLFLFPSILGYSWLLLNNYDVFHVYGVKKKDHDVNSLCNLVPAWFTVGKESSHIMTILLSRDLL